MKLYICHDVKEKDDLLSRGLKYQASGHDPVTKEKYWVYIENDLFNKLKKEE